MRMCFALFLLLSVLSSCSTASKRATSAPSPDMPSRPAWIDDPMSDCSRIRELCASGADTGMMGADAAARKSLAQIFETQIKSTLSATSSTTQQHDESGVLRGDVREHVASTIDEAVEQVLNGVSIKKRYQDGTGFYALAFLDKRDAASKLKTEMDVIDDKMQELLKDKRRSSFRSLSTLFESREGLSARYQFLEGASYPRKVSYADVYGTKAANAQTGKSVLLTIKGQDTNDELNSYVTGELSDRHYKVVRSSSEKAAYSLLLDIDARQDHFNVDGFVKFTFSARLTLKSGADDLAHIDTHSTQTGRSRDDAYAKALADLRKQIDDQFDELGLN